jgi:hypothetical protein
VVALNTLVRKQRRRAAVLACVVALGDAVVVAHGSLGLDHIGSAATTCVAVLQVGAVLALAGFLLTRRSPRSQGSAVVAPLLMLAPRPRPQPRARASPSLQVLRL